MNHFLIYMSSIGFIHSLFRLLIKYFWRFWISLCIMDLVNLIENFINKPVMLSSLFLAFIWSSRALIFTPLLVKDREGGIWPVWHECFLWRKSGLSRCLYNLFHVWGGFLQEYISFKDFERPSRSLEIFAQVLSMNVKLC